MVGVMNTQFAVQGSEIYVLEVNPRASRTIPFVSKATGVPLAKVGALCMMGRSLAEQGIDSPVSFDYFSVKESVFPFVKFPGVDPLLGPEMKSTGEVMGVGQDFPEAFAKAQYGANMALPKFGMAFISVRDRDKAEAVKVATKLVGHGLELIATRGTASYLNAAGVDCLIVNKVREGQPHVVDMIKNEEISYIVNTTEGRQAIKDSYSLRRSALQHNVPYTTTIAGAMATSLALAKSNLRRATKLQDMHARSRV